MAADDLSPGDAGIPAAGTCPRCGSDLLYVESLLVRQETRIASVETQTIDHPDETWVFPVLSDDTDALVTERVSAHLSCAGVDCAYVFDSPFLGEPDDTQPSGDAC